MKAPRPALALGVALSFFAQTTGAADLAVIRPLPPALLMPKPLPAGRVSLPRHESEPWRLGTWTRAYLSDAAVVAHWLLTPEAPALPPARTMPRQAPALKPEPLAGPEPVRDRMLVAKDPEFVGAAEALSGALSRAPEALAGEGVPAFRLQTVEMPWLQGDGFRFRVVYTDALGRTEGLAGGFRVRFAGLPEKFVKAPVPQALRRTAPIYVRQMRIRFRIEVEAHRSLSGLSVSFSQEELDGRVLTKPESAVLPDLKAGQTAAVDADVPMLGHATSAAVNFERTHVRVTGQGGAALADEPAAGLVDPPGL